MNNKNTYLDKILTLPSKKIKNKWFSTIFLFTIIFIPIVFFSFYDNVSFINNIFPKTTFFLKIFIVFFVILSIFFRFLIKKFPQFIFIYISISFGSFSLFSFIISCVKIYYIGVFGAPFNVLFLLIAIIIYLLEIIFFIIFFINKEKKNSTSSYNNHTLSRSSISIISTLGVLASYHYSFNSLKFMILILSYITLRISLVGINRFRLLIKDKVNIKK